MDTTTDPVAPSGGVEIPQITPDFSGPGISGMTSFGAQLAGWALILGGIAVILGVIIAVVGPRFGFHGAKALGMGGIVGGLIIGAVVAMATPGVQTVYDWFS